VSTQNAAPGAHDPGTAASDSGFTDRLGARSISQLPIAPAIAARLAAEGVANLADWRALGSRRKKFFGIVPSMVARLDALARGAS
jgi:hypothetical protein